jgi:hypothetical protein
VNDFSNVALVSVHASRFVTAYLLLLAARGEVDSRFAVPIGLGELAVAAGAVGILVLRVLIVRRLEGKEVKVDASHFDAYVGDYQVNARMTLTITKEGDKLFAQFPGQERHALEPVSETQFTIPDVKSNITFEKDAAGVVTGLLLSQGTRTANAKKIK